MIEKVLGEPFSKFFISFAWRTTCKKLGCALQQGNIKALWLGEKDTQKGHHRPALQPDIQDT